VHISEPILAKMPGGISQMDATILQPNLSPLVRLRQKSGGKACLFLSGDDKNEHMFGFRDQKVAGSNPVTSTTVRPKTQFSDGYFMHSPQKQAIT